MRFIIGKLVVAMGLLVPLIAGTTGFAAEATVGLLKINHVWARPSFGKAPNSAAFLTITNSGATADVLVAAETAASKKAELHTHINDGGVMRMRHVSDGITIPAGQTVTLKPGGYHVMLLGLTAPLTKGSKMPLKLTFRDAGTVTVAASIEMRAVHGGTNKMKHKH